MQGFIWGRRGHLHPYVLYIYMHAFLLHVHVCADTVSSSQAPVAGSLACKPSYRPCRSPTRGPWWTAGRRPGTWSRRCWKMRSCRRRLRSVSLWRVTIDHRTFTSYQPKLYNSFQIKSTYKRTYINDRPVVVYVHVHRACTHSPQMSDQMMRLNWQILGGW